MGEVGALGSTVLPWSWHREAAEVPGSTESGEDGAVPTLTQTVEVVASFDPESPREFRAADCVTGRRSAPVSLHQVTLSLV